MNPESQIPQPSPESDCGGGVPPQTVPEASRSEFTLPTPHPPTHSHNLHPYEDMGFVDPPEMPAEPDYDGDYDYEESARERELMLDDLADYNDDFSRSNDEGWFYSDGD